MAEGRGLTLLGGHPRPLLERPAVPGARDQAGHRALRHQGQGGPPGVEGEGGHLPVEGPCPSSTCSPELELGAGWGGGWRRREGGWGQFRQMSLQFTPARSTSPSTLAKKLLTVLCASLALAARASKNSAGNMSRLTPSPSHSPNPSCRSSSSPSIWPGLGRAWCGACWSGGRPPPTGRHRSRGTTAQL